jgi:hypothetical protein
MGFIGVKCSPRLRDGPEFLREVCRVQISVYCFDLDPKIPPLILFLRILHLGLHATQLPRRPQVQLKNRKEQSCGNRSVAGRLRWRALAC